MGVDRGKEGDQGQDGEGRQKALAGVAVRTVFCSLRLEMDNVVAMPADCQDTRFVG